MKHHQIAYGYGCRCSAASSSLKHLVTATTTSVTLPQPRALRHFTRARARFGVQVPVRAASPSSSPRSLAPLSFLRRPSSSSSSSSHLLTTGNSPFSRMEELSCHVVWKCFVSLIFIIGVHCTSFSDDIQSCTCDGPLLTATQPMALSRLDKRYWTGVGINKNKAMVEQLQSYGIIRSKKVAEVMEKIDRALFVPEGTPPYVDSPMPIGYNATISAPHMHATCLELLLNNLQPGMHALDIGSGSGYLTACFAMMVGRQGHAVGVEHIPELVDASIKNVQKSAAAPLLKEGALSLHVGDGRLGWPEHAPYDAIHVGAAAPEIPKPLFGQLKPGGRMVIPVGNIFQDLKVVDKNLDGSISVHDETSVRYVPLTSREAQLRGF